MDIAELLLFCVKQQASDLHLSAGVPPMLRVDGEMRRVNLPALGAAEVEALLRQVLTPGQWQSYTTSKELDLSYALGTVARFRVNAFHSQRGTAAAFRRIPNQVPTLEGLGCPAVFGELLKHHNGLVLVTGPTGSGKSTTLAAMVEHLNTTYPYHILTIEDPIEFLHEGKRALVHQRELGRDTLDSAAALRAALREDPDVILVGELRDLETIRLALTAAETGHLVLATLHTSSAAQTINRIVDVFPGNEKALIRSMLAESLRAVIAQSLLKHVAGGRLAAFEVLVATAAVRNLIREDKLAQLYSALQTGAAQGMQTLEQHVARLLAAGEIGPAEAERYQAVR